MVRNEDLAHLLAAIGGHDDEIRASVTEGKLRPVWRPYRRAAFPIEGQAHRQGPLHRVDPEIHPQLGLAFECQALSVGRQHGRQVGLDRDRERLFSPLSVHPGEAAEPVAGYTARLPDQGAVVCQVVERPAAKGGFHIGLDGNRRTPGSKGHGVEGGGDETPWLGINEMAARRIAPVASAFHQDVSLAGIQHEGLHRRISEARRRGPNGEDHCPSAGEELGPAVSLPRLGKRQRLELAPDGG